MRAAVWLLVLCLSATAVSVAMPGATIFFLFGLQWPWSGVALERRSPRTAFALAVLGTLIQFADVRGIARVASRCFSSDGPLWAVAPLAALAALAGADRVGDARLRPAIAALLVTAAGLWIAAMILPARQRGAPGRLRYRLFSRRRPRQRFLGHRRQASATAGRLPRRLATRCAALQFTRPLDRKAPLARHAGARPQAGCERSSRRAAPRPDRPARPGGADAVTIRFPKDAKFARARSAGSPDAIPAKGEPEKALLRCAGRSCDGLRHRSRCSRTAADRGRAVFLVSFRLACPQGRPLAAARPANAIPQYSPDSTITMTRIRL